MKDRLAVARGVSSGKALNDEVARGRAGVISHVAHTVVRKNGRTEDRFPISFSASCGGVLRNCVAFDKGDFFKSEAIEGIDQLVNLVVRSGDLAFERGFLLRRSGGGQSLAQLIHVPTLFAQ